MYKGSKFIDYKLKDNCSLSCEQSKDQYNWVYTQYDWGH